MALGLVFVPYLNLPLPLIKPLTGSKKVDTGFEIEIETNALLKEELENPSRQDRLFWVHPEEDASPSDSTSKVSSGVDIDMGGSVCNS